MKRNAYLTTKQRSRGISWSFFGCQHGRARRPGSDNAHCVNQPGGFHAFAQGPLLPEIFDCFDYFDIFVYNVISDNKHSDAHH